MHRYALQTVNHRDDKSQPRFTNSNDAAEAEVHTALVLLNHPNEGSQQQRDPDNRENNHVMAHKDHSNPSSH
jgi:hypothetical protein